MEIRRHDVLLRGLRLHYAEMGAGPPLLLVHGLAVSHEEWLPTLPLLAQHFRCIAPDLPGHGKSEKRSPADYAYTREAFADTVADLLSALGIARAHVCGHSMGGGISLVLAADRPEMVDRLVVIDPLSLPNPLPLKGRIPLLPVVGAFFWRQLYKRRLFRAYFTDDVWSGHAGVDLAQVDRYYETFDTADAREATYAALKATVVDVSSLGPKIARVRAPTLILWGEEDRIFPASLGPRVAREIAGSRLQVIETCGHAPNEEKPAETADLVIEHLLGKAE